MEPLYSLLSTLRTLDPESLDQEYNAVRSQTNVLKRDLGLTTEAGALQENIKKNRYKDVLPYDQSRVVLSLSVTNCDSDYINASFIKGATAGHSYIASQGPLSSTVTDFWRMIWQYDIKVIVMACREIEMGKKKCECYWAPVNQSATFGPFTVCNEEESSPSEELVVRNLTVAFHQDNRSLVQYQFLSWPDHDVPYEPERVLDLLVQARNSQGTHTSPLLIHCSAGCGRTGVICALDYIHDLLVTKEITSDFSIKKIVLELRKQRPAAVQTKDQYHFIFKVVISMFERFLQSIRDPLFSNMSEKSEEKTTRAPVSTSSRLSQTDMNATYAVVNKPKHQPSPIPAYSTVATPKTNPAIRTPPSSHHYDNDPVAAPVYSTVKPRAKHSAAPIYTAPHSHVNGELPLTLVNNAGYGLTSAEASSPTDDDYEDISSSDTTNLRSPGMIGFNCRVQKPRGPRDPPAEWSQLER